MLHGSVTLRAAATATAASAAFPPAFRTRTPISVARGWLEATAPCSETTGERREVKDRWWTYDSPAILFRCSASLSRMEIVKNSSYPSHGNQLQFLLACIVYSRPLPSARARIGEKSLLRYFLRGGGSCTQAKLLHVGNRRIFTSCPVNHVKTYNWHVIAKPFNRVTWNSFISRGNSVTWERGI